MVPVEQRKVDFKEMTESMVTKNRMNVGKRTAVVTTVLTLVPSLMFVCSPMEAGDFFIVQPTHADAERKGARLRETSPKQTEALVTKYLVARLNAAVIQPERIPVDAENSPAPLLHLNNVRLEADYTSGTLSMFSGLKFTWKSEALMRNESVA